ncbi:MAG: cupin domain-containing protein [Actinobacteria bacterium]|nr:cupin domain-containing protein [Actinomycetota bacterium]OJU83277.1 MAG: hypothetical protein BGO11_06155 [Solirubrobacterales bacterium 70-9]
MRLIVTGQREDGLSVYVADEKVEPVLPPTLGGNEIYRLWGSDEPPILPTEGSRPDAPAYYAPAHGYRFSFFTIPSAAFEAEPIKDIDAAIAETERLTPGLSAALTDHEGMHATDTVDLLLVISGEVHLELDSGEVKVIKAGDCCVQNGTNHAWYNRHPTEPCVICAIFIGAERRP